tara:strand:- start:1171 stop:1467 length:297 start_codon:yes stop_codon:yes gene_type:complete
VKIIQLLIPFKTIILFIFLVSGCTTGTGGSLVKLDDDTYLVANTQYGSSGSSQKVKAIQKAVKYCEKMGKTMEVQSSKQSDGAIGSLPSAEVIFNCID